MSIVTINAAPCDITYPGRNCKPQSRNVVITQSLDNAREEVLESLGEQSNMLEEDKNVEAIIFDSELETNPYGAGMLLIGLVDILQQAPHCKGLFIVVEPAGGMGVVRQQKRSQKPNKDRKYSFLTMLSALNPDRVFR